MFPPHHLHTWFGHDIAPTEYLIECWVCKGTFWGSEMLFTLKRWPLGQRWVLIKGHTFTHGVCFCESSWLHENFHISVVHREHFSNEVLLGSVLAAENSAANNTVARPSIRSGQGFPAIFPYKIGSSWACVCSGGEMGSSLQQCLLCRCLISACHQPRSGGDERKKRKVVASTGDTQPGASLSPPNEAVLKNIITRKKERKKSTPRCHIFKPNSKTPCHRTVSLTTTTYGGNK